MELNSESLIETFFTLSKSETEYIYCIHYNLEDVEFWYYDYIMPLNVFKFCRVRILNHFDNIMSTLYVFKLCRVRTPD